MRALIRRIVDHILGCRPKQVARRRDLYGWSGTPDDFSRADSVDTAAEWHEWPTEPVKPEIGQRVACIFDGVFEGYDQETGHYTLRGNTRGAQHIDWTIQVHWATTFYRTDHKEN
jgi:hypothetical protein